MAEHSELERPSFRSEKNHLSPVVRGERGKAPAGSWSQIGPDDLEHAPPAVHLRDYLRILHKRRWTAVGTLAAIMLATVVYVLASTPAYEATARLLIEVDKPNVVAFKDVVEPENGTDEYYQTRYKLLAGRALAARTIDALNLWNNPELTDQSQPNGGWLHKTIDGAAALIGRPRPPLPSFESAPSMRQSMVVDAFSSRLVVSPVRNSRLVDVRFRSKDPVLAAKVANAHASAFVEQSVDFKFATSRRASDFLADRLAEQRRQVEDSEVAVQRYREKNDALSLEERQNIVVQKLADINAAVTKAKTERIEKEALFAQVQGVQSDRRALDSLAAVLSNQYIQQLKSQLAELQRQQAELSDRLGDRHPDLVKVKSSIQSTEGKLQLEIANISKSVQNDYLAAEARERGLMQALEAQKREALALNRKAIEGNVLKRDADSNKVLYDSLLQRAKETGITGELKASAIRVVDPAEVPRVPADLNPKQLLALAMCLGCLVAVGLAFFAEYLDDRIKTPVEISGELGLATLGLIPRVASRLVGPRSLIRDEVPANVSEAFRTVRTSVLFSDAGEDGRARAILVTSSTPGEGKTVAASNLAVAISQAGERVLLVDADMRRPKVHEMFGLVQAPGLSNLLTGAVLAKEAIHTTETPGLWVLPAGGLLPNPAELLASKRFTDFLASVGGLFDWIVIDSPPVLAVTDATIIAHVVDGFVFVVGAEMTSRRTAATAVEQLQRANARCVGAILNRVDLKRNGYFYSQYYKRSYTNYYAPSA